MFNGTNMLGKDNPRWPISNAPETKTVPEAIRAGYCFAVAWLIGLPRRAGRYLFAMNDAEARWHHWQVTETLGGFGRWYRDPRFAALNADTAARHGETASGAIRSDDDGCPLNGDR